MSVTLFRIFGEVVVFYAFFHLIRAVLFDIAAWFKRHRKARF
jgi:hypothetical protein